MFDPTRALEGLHIASDSVVGLSNIRALLGGAITAIGISVVIAAVTYQIGHARPAVLFMISIVAGRVVGLIVDGYDSTAAAFILPPVVVLTLLLVAHRLHYKSMLSTSVGVSDGRTA
jgi:hypothetical protein